MSHLTTEYVWAIKFKEIKLRIEWLYCYVHFFVDLLYMEGGECAIHLQGSPDGYEKIYQALEICRFLDVGISVEPIAVYHVVFVV